MALLGAFTAPAMGIDFGENSSTTFNTFLSGSAERMLGAPDEAAITRDGQITTGPLSIEKGLDWGLRITHEFDPQWSAIVQIGVSTDDQFTPKTVELQWAYLHSEHSFFGIETTFDVGKKVLPTFRASDYKNVHFIFTTQGPPDSYELIPIHTFSGGEINIEKDLFGTPFGLTLYAGQTTIRSNIGWQEDILIPFEGIIGGKLTTTLLDTDLWAGGLVGAATIKDRAFVTKLDTALDGALPLVPIADIFGTLNIKFYNAGFSKYVGRTEVLGEWHRRAGDDTTAQIDSYYFLLAHNLGRMTPYIAGEVVDQIGAGLLSKQEYKSVTGGLAFAATSSLKLKAEYTKFNMQLAGRNRAIFKTAMPGIEDAGILRFSFSATY